MDADHAADDQLSRAPDAADAWSALLPASANSDPWPGLAAGALAHVGDPQAETRLLRDGAPALVPLRTHGALRLTGADRVDFVNGLVSHDVRTLATGAARAALMLDHRGRPRAGLSVVRRERDLYLAVDDGAVRHVRQTLEAHIVFDDVELVDLSGRIVALVVSGDAALERLAALLGLAALPESGSEALGQHGWGAYDVLLHARERGLRRSLDVHVLREQLPDLVEELRRAGAHWIGERALAAARVARGLAAAAFEGAEALPQECGLEARVSYRKGCYLGQEIMARVEARSSVRRSLARLRFDAPPDPSPALEVHDLSDRTVGRIGTLARGDDGAWRALAVVRRDVPDDAPLRALGAAATLEARDL